MTAGMTGIRFFGNRIAKEQQVRDTIYEKFEKHISFAQEMAEKQYISDEARYRFKEKLSEIVNKHNDKQLNLSVVGEFSSGKSTFINALLRKDDFLVSSILQGTTVASTVIENSESFSFCAVNHDGTKEERNFYDADALHNGIVEYTTNPEYGQKLSHITIALPSPILSRGFRIIDTPGTSSLERWHEEVTVKAIKEFSDTSIIIIDATKVLPESFCGFIEENLSSVLDRCVFVVTRIDLVRKGERESVLSYIKQKIESRFDIEDPVILPYCSTEVLDALGNCEDSSELSTLSPDFYSNEKFSEPVKSSLQSEEQMLGHILQNKTRMQAEKLAGLMQEMYTCMNNEISKILAVHGEELGNLEISRQSELEPFLEREIENRQSSFSERVKASRDFLEQRLDKNFDSIKDTVFNEMEKQKDIEKLTHYIYRKKHEKYMKKETAEIIKREREAFRNLEKTVDLELNIFYRDFQAEFKDMKELAVKTGFRPDKRTVKADADINKEESKAVKDKMKTWYDVYLSCVRKPMIIGFCIGLPFYVVGGFVGMLIGYFIGKSKAPQYDNVKRSMKDSMTVFCGSYFSETKNEILREFDANAAAAYEVMTKDIERYTKYSGKVEKLVAADDKVIEGARKKYNVILADANSILELKNSLMPVAENHKANSKDTQFLHFAQALEL